ncbi:MAG: endo-1,4-beta-xylanase [Kiritimatiellia bacterium]|jgi:endo-1,4-beta-xylanase
MISNFSHPFAARTPRSGRTARAARLLAALVAFSAIPSSWGRADPATPAAAPPAAAPIVILKMDDLTPRGADPAKGQAVSGNFTAFIDTIRKLEVKASLGIIGNSLEDASPEFCEWIKALHDEGIVEFWNHGYSHREFPREGGRRRTEFAGPSLEEQIESLGKTQRLARQKLGFDLKAFGSPFNQFDGTTARALDAFPEITSWFYGPARATTDRRRSLERRLDLESPVMKPNSAQLIDAFNAYGKDLQYIVLQGHPNGWGGKQRAEFVKAVQFLKDQGCVFMTPSEFLAVKLREPSLLSAPSKPKAAATTARAAPASPPLPAPTPKPQLLKNPTLLDLDGNGLPDHWYRSTGEQGAVEMLSDAVGRFLRIRVDAPGESVILQQFVPLPAGDGPITVAAKVRWADIVRGERGYMAGAVQMMFANDRNAKVGDHLPLETFKGTSRDWRIVAQTFPRPPGATKFRVQLALYSVKGGALDVAWCTAASGPAPAAPLPEELAAANAPAAAPAASVGTGPVHGGVRGRSLLGDDPFAFLQPFGDTDKFELTRFTVADQPFTNAIRVAVRDSVPAVWDLQLRAKCPVALKKGDVLLLTYWMRGVKIDSEFGETFCVNALQLDRKPWTKVFEFKPRAKLGDGWVKLQRVIVSRESFAANQYAFNFQFGLDPQTFEIGGLSLYNYGSAVDPATLPRTEAKLYDGHEPDAPWRADAHQRIDRIRKGDIDILVVDAAGRPVPDADVKVEMTRHAFGWGSAVYAWTFAGTGEDNRIYREKFLELFNLMVPENGLKWPSWENPKFRETTTEMIDWALANGCEVRGHTLVWPSFRRTPARLAGLRDDPDKLRGEIQKHIADIVTANKGKIRAWDVMNEPTTNHEFMDILGAAEPAAWFKQAAELDPDAQLFLNENQILAGTKLRSLELHLDKVLEHGGPLGGIGIQGHLGVGTAAPQKILEIFDRLARYQVPLSITELDILSDNPEEQAMYLRDVLTAAFSHPAIDSVTFWGFWDGRHWKSNTPLFRRDWTEKPGLAVYRQLVLNDWWTRETLRTGADGHARARGFLGDYTITVAGHPPQPATLPKTGLSLRIVIGR